GVRRRADRRPHRLGAEVLVSAPAYPSALPYVSWSSVTFAEIPAESWEAVYGSMQALKAHVQEYPGCQKFEAYVDRGYTFARMLADVGGLEAEPTRVMEKVF